MRLAIFDVDGTLVDSQAHIVSAMTAAFEYAGLPVPPRSQILGGVGLSLPLLMEELGGRDHADKLVEGYRIAWQSKADNQAPPLYPGTQTMLEDLSARGDVILAVATGKSKRGLDQLLASHGLADVFVSLQCADFHPSKPHPSMVQTILAETDMVPEAAVMIGDTSFDIDMGRAAGVGTIAVPWGYHRPEGLGADHIISDWDEVADAIFEVTDG